MHLPCTSLYSRTCLAMSCFDSIVEGPRVDIFAAVFYINLWRNPFRFVIMMIKSVIMMVASSIGMQHNVLLDELVFQGTDTPYVLNHVADLCRVRCWASPALALPK